MNRYACRAFRRRRPRHQEVYIAGIRRSSSCNCVATSAQAPGCSEAQTKYTLSADLIQLRLTQFDHDELNTEEAEADAIAEYEAKIAALERKSGQLTMELELVKKHRACAS